VISLRDALLLLAFDLTLLFPYTMALSSSPAITLSCSFPVLQEAEGLPDCEFRESRAFPEFELSEREQTDSGFA
jgi:hypothetical protein